MRHVWVTAVLAGPVIQSAFAQWTAINLHPAGASKSHAYDVDRGQQVGEAVFEGRAHAGLWTGAGASWVDLHPAGAYSSRAAGVADGHQAGMVTLEISGKLWSRASRWRGTAGSWVNIHPPGRDSSRAAAVAGGQQVGDVRPVYTEAVRATLWNGTAESSVNLDPDGWPSTPSLALAIDQGRQFGYAELSYAGYETHAGSWGGSADSWVDMHPAGSSYSSVYGAGGGQQAGYAMVGGIGRASLWYGTASSWVDLHPAEASASVARGAHGGRQVGAARVDGALHASLWSGTRDSWQDLHVLTAGSWEYTDAEGVWSDGTVVYVAGYGRNLDTGREEALLWTNDSDGDGLPDAWETEDGGIDADGDGTIDLNLHALGARPDHKDLFVEVDAMHGWGPAPFAVLASDRARMTENHIVPTGTALDKVVVSFLNAPVANPDGQTGVRLHITIDRTDLPAEDWIDGEYGWTQFDTVKEDNFGTPSSPTLLEALRRCYRYCVFAKRIDTDQGGVYGIAELPGNDFIVAIDALRHGPGSPDDQATTFMHELGHTLGLRHTGDDVGEALDEFYNYKPNYRSVMNYMWCNTADALLPSFRLDYSRERLPDVNEAHLDETKGLDLGKPFLVVVGPPDAPRLTLTTIPFNFDGDDDFTETDVQFDINRLLSTMPASPGTVMAGHEDWSTLVYTFRASPDYADARHQSSKGFKEPPAALIHYLESIPVPCRPDCNGDAKLNVNDFICFQSLWREQHPFGDFNGDGRWNINDFIAFQSDFRRGCP